jgi:osmoprotectant transport system permease protein
MMVAHGAGVVAADEPFVRWDWVWDHTDDFRAAFWEHLTLTAVSVSIGFVISMVLALVAVRWRWTYEPLAGFTGALYAVPSLALFGILITIPWFGLGFRTAVAALVTYTLLILLRNIVAGLEGVPPAVREAADGMGYEGWRRVLRVDVPLAVPAIIAGLRVATVTTVGLVTVTALVGAGGFGDLINDGLSRDFPTPIVVGTVLSVALAVALDLVFVVVERLVTPWARAGDAPSRRRRGRRERRHGLVDAARRLVPAGPDAAHGDGAGGAS